MTFQEHIKSACLGKDGADTWIKAGIEFLGEEKVCPFCGQNIQNQNLLKSFSEYLSEDYQAFKKELKKDIQEINLNWNVFTLAKRLVVLQKRIDEAKEIIGKDVVTLKEEIEKICRGSLTRRNLQLEKLRTETELVLNSKVGLCNVSVDLDVELIKKINSFYSKKIIEVKAVVDDLNAIVEKVQKEIKENTDGEKEDELKEKLSCVENKLTRLFEDDICKDWMKQFEKINRMNAELKEKSDGLENDQKEYLDLYFEKIDQIFRRYGGRKIKIARSDFSNRGFKKIIGISISFNETHLSQSGHVEFVFSESDKRALALAIFMAKLDCMEASERMKTIVVWMTRFQVSTIIG